MKKNTIKLIFISGYFVFIILSFLFGYGNGKVIGNNFINFTIDMLRVLPCAFILIGLFEVWVKKETIEKHLGKESGFMCYVWAILLAGTTVGGLYVSFPVAYSLHNKGAKLSFIFTYIGASAICRIPMTIFEASFMGIKFTIIRLFVSLPLVIISSIILAKYLENKGYRIAKDK